MNRGLGNTYRGLKQVFTPVNRGVFNPPGRSPFASHGLHIKNARDLDMPYTETILQREKDKLRKQGKEGDCEALATSIINRNLADPALWLLENHKYYGKEFDLPGYNPALKNKIVIPTGDRKDPWRVVSKEESLKKVLLIGGKDTGINPALVMGLIKRGMFPGDGHVLYIGHNAYHQDSEARRLHVNAKYYDSDTEEVAQHWCSRLIVTRDGELEPKDPCDKFHVMTHSAGQKTFLRIINAAETILRTGLGEQIKLGAFQRFCDKHVRTRGLAIAPLVWKDQVPKVRVNTFSEFYKNDMGTTPLRSMFPQIQFNQNLKKPFTLFEVPTRCNSSQFFIVYNDVSNKLEDGKPNILGHSCFALETKAAEVLPDWLQKFRKDYFLLSPEELKDYSKKLHEAATIYTPHRGSIDSQGAGYLYLTKVVAGDLEAQAKIQEEYQAALKAKQAVEGTQVKKNAMPSTPASELKEVEIAKGNKKELVRG